MKHIFCTTFVLLLLVSGLRAAETPAMIEVKVGNSGGICSIAFSPDSTKIVTAAKDKTACIWNAETGEKLRTLQHANWVRTAVFSPDGKKIVTACDDNTARFWDAESGQMLQKLEGHTNLCTADISPDGRNIVTVDTTVREKPDERENIVRIWDTESGTVHKLEGHTARVLSTLFSADGRKLATSGYDGIVRLWDVASGKELKKWEGRVGVAAFKEGCSIPFSPDGKKIVTVGMDNTARIWDVESGKELQKLEGHTECLYSASFSPDGKKIVTTSKDETARIWNVESGKELQLLQGNPDDRFDTRMWGMIVIPPKGKEGVAKVQFDSAVFSPDGKYVLSSGDSRFDQTARIWDAESGKELYVLGGHEGELILCASFSPDGKKVVTAAGHMIFRIWDLERISPPQTRPAMMDF